MTDFNEIYSHLSNHLDRFDEVAQIEDRQEFLIVDYKGQSFIIMEIQTDDHTYTIRLNGVDTVIDNCESDKVFHVSDAKRVGFIPIDGKKGLLGYGNSHCDFVFFDASDFCFVEFKLNATSDNERAVRKNREKAIGQLANTINYFDGKLDRNYVGLTLEAYVCTPEFYPRDDASWKTFAIEFLENYGIPLFESNHKKCQ